MKLEVQKQKDFLIKTLATGFGSGLAPFAPGTAGTLVGIPVFLIFSTLTWPFYLLALGIMTALAVYLAQAAEYLIGKHDDPSIVIDEMTGFLWTMICIFPTFGRILLGFIFFRLFDIVKPFPVRKLQDKLPGGYGIVADDIMAGIYSNLALQILIKFSVL